MTRRRMLFITIGVAILAMAGIALTRDTKTTDTTSTTIINKPADTTTLPPTTSAATTTSTSSPALPLPAELVNSAPDPAKMGNGASGLFKVAKDQEIPFDTQLFAWASNLSYGHERVMEFQSVNDDDPMQTHTANFVLRALVFATPTDATASMSQYQREMGHAVTSSYFRDGVAYAGLSYEAVGQPLSNLVECMTRRGAVVVWAIIQDSSPRQMAESACNYSRSYLTGVLESYPALG